VSSTRPSASGQATVELVLALPIVVGALLLVIQVGLIASSQVAVIDAAREGARAGAAHGTVVAAERGARSSGSLATDRMLVGASVDETAGGMVRVRVRYRVPTDVPLVGVVIPEPTVTAEVAMRVERPLLDTG